MVNKCPNCNKVVDKVTGETGKGFKCGYCGHPVDAINEAGHTLTVTYTHHLFDDDGNCLIKHIE